MIKLDLTSGFKAALVRSGVSSRGNWELIVVKEEGRGKRQITIWPTNAPSGVVEGNLFRIKNIPVVKYGARKDQNGNWRDDVSIEAEVESMSYTDNGSAFDDLDDCPFAMGEDPFANASAYGGGSDPFADLEDKLPL